MITETGTVVAVEKKVAWVQTQVQTTCSSCQLSSGCGSGLLSRYFARKLFVTPVPNVKGAAKGDEVTIAIPEQLLVSASILVYLAPLAGLLFGALGLTLIVPSAHEGWSIAAGGGGFLLGWWIARITAGKRQENAQLRPEMLSVKAAAIPLTYLETSDESPHLN